MSERGVFAVDRGIWSHDVLAENKPLSRREAWLWLLSEAAWKAHRRRIGGRPIELNRGQLVASLRFIADKWRWTEPRVRRFLSTLKNEGMIDTATDAGITIITICKYDRYQRVSLPTDATAELQPDAATTQQRRKVEDIEHKGDPNAAAERLGLGVKKPLGLKAPMRGTPLPHSLISEEAFALAVQVIDALGPNAAGAPIEVGAPAHCQKWINEGWEPESCLTAVRQVMARRGPSNPPNTLRFFDKAISQYHAEMYRPLQKTNIKPQETTDAKNRKNFRLRPNSWERARSDSIIDGLRRAHEVLGIDLGGEIRSQDDLTLSARNDADP